MKVQKPSQLTVAQRKALDRELNRQIGEGADKLKVDIAALVLWAIHCEYGYGEKRLKNYLLRYLNLMAELKEWYAMDKPGDAEWLCKTKLKEIGIDVDELAKMFDIEGRIV